MEIGKQIVHLTSVDSTNNYAAEHARSGTLAVGAVIVAHEQTAGRGQRGNPWHMSPGRDLAMSVIMPPDRLNTATAFDFNKAFALSVALAIQPLVDKVVHIKWPNDIVIDDCKVAGILIEPSWMGEKCMRVICGLGVNVCSERKAHGRLDASLLDLGAQVTLESVLTAVVEEVNQVFSLLSNEPKRVLAAYNDRLYRRGERVSFQIGGNQVDARVIAVSGRGELILDVDGEVETYAHPDVRIPFAQPL